MSAVIDRLNNPELVKKEPKKETNVIDRLNNLEDLPEEEDKFVPRIVEKIPAETAANLYDGKGIGLEVANDTKVERDKKEAYSTAQNTRIVQDANKDHRKATAIQDDLIELGDFENAVNEGYDPQGYDPRTPFISSVEGFIPPDKDTNIITDIAGATVGGVIGAGKDIYRQATDPNVTSISDAITAGTAQDKIMIANTELLWLVNASINNPDDAEAQQAVVEKENYINMLEGQQPKTPYTITGEAFQTGSASIEMIKDLGWDLGTIVAGSTVFGGIAGATYGKTPVAKGVEYLDRRFGTDLSITAGSGFRAGIKGAGYLSPWFMAGESVKRTVGETYGGLRKIVDENGKPLPHDVMFGAAHVAGIAKTALESAGLMYIFKQTGIGKTIIERIAKEGVAKLVREKGARAIFASIGKRMAKASALEATQESFQTVIDIVTTEFAKLSSDENEFKKIFGTEFKDGEFTEHEGKTQLEQGFEWVKGKGEEVGHAAILGGLVGGGFTGAGASANTLFNAGVDYTQGKYENQQIKTMSDAANNTKTMQRNRKLMEDLTEGVLKDKEFKIPAHKIKEYFQSDDELTEFLEDNPEIATQWEQSSNLYGDISLPANKALSIFADERYTGLREHAVMSDDAILEVDLDEEFEHRITKAFKLEEKQNKSLDEINNIVASLQGSIEKAGETKQTAKAVGSLYKALLETGQGDTAFYEKLKERVKSLEVEADFGFKFSKGDKTREDLIKAREGVIQKNYEASQAGISEAYRKTGESISERAKNVTTKKAQKEWVEQEAKAIHEELKQTKEALPKREKKQQTLRGLIKASGGINPYAAMGLTHEEVANIKSRKGGTNLKQKYNELVEKYGKGIFSYKAPATNGFDWAEQIGLGSQFQVEDILATLENGGDMVSEVQSTERSDAETYFNDAYSIKLGATLKDIQKQLKADLTFSKDGSSYFGVELYQDTKKVKRGSIQFLDDKTIIKLFEGRNLSTLVHETGHFFLDVLADATTLENAPQRYTDMMDGVLKYFDVKSYSDITVEHHEKFARQFESYLREGKAPSASLRDTFNAIKNWLVDVYRNIKNGKIPAKPSKELSKIFDMLLATDDAIKQASNTVEFMPDATVLDMLGTVEKKRYLKAREDALQTAKDKIYKKLLNEEKRNATKWWKEQEVLAKKTAEDIANSDTIYGIISALKGDITPDGLNMKLDKKAFRTDHSEFLDVMPKGIWAKEGGTTLEAIADLHGIGDVKQLALDIVNKIPRDKYIKEKTQEIMLKKFGDTLNDGTITQKAFEALHNEDLSDMKYIEVQLVAKRANIETPKKVHYRAYAKKILNGTVLNKILPNVYYRAELRASRNFSKHLANKDFEKATQAKEAELINHYLYREARAIKEKQPKIVKYLTKIVKKQKGLTKKKKQFRASLIDQEYHEKIIELLKAYEDGGTMDVVTMQRWVNEKQDNGEYIAIPSILKGGKRYSELTYSEFSALHNTVLSIEKTGRLKHSVFMGGKLQDIVEIEDGLLVEIKKNVKRRKQSRIKETGLMPALRNMVAMQLKFREFIDILDGGEALGKWYTALMRGVDEKYPIMLAKTHDASKHIEGMIKKHYKGKGLDGRKKVYIKELEVYKDGELVMNGEITQEQIVSVLLNMGNEDNRTKLIEGNVVNITGEDVTSWSEVQINAILKHITKEDVAFANDVWKYIDSFWNEVADLEKARTGFVPTKVEATPFDIVVDGKTHNLSGGYYPISYDRSITLTGKQTQFDKVDELKERTMLGRSGVMAKNNHTKERTKSVGYPIKLGLDAFYRHIENVIFDLNIGQELDSSYKIFKRGAVQTELKERLGVEKTNFMDLWFQDVSVNGLIVGEGFEKIVNKIRANSSVAILGGNIKTVLMQAGGIAHSVAGVGAGYTARAIAEYGASPLKTLKFSAASSAVLRDRFIFMNRDIADTHQLMTQGKAATWHKNMVKYGFLPMVATQYYTADIITWNAAYAKGADMQRKGHKNIKTEEDVILYADNALVQLQASGMQKDLSAIERGTSSMQTRLNAMNKVYTMFYSYMNAKLNIMYRNNNKLRRDGLKQAPKWAMNMTMLVVGEAFLTDAMLGLLPDNEEDETTWGDYVLKTALSQVAGSIFAVRELASVVQGFGDFGGVRGVGAMVKSGQQALDEASKTWEEDEEFSPRVMLRYLLTFVSFAKGVPIATPIRMMKTEEKRIDGEEVEAMDYIRYKAK